MATLKTQPTAYFAQLQGKSIEAAITSPDLPISLLKREAGEVYTKALLVKLLADLVKFFNVGKSMNSDQVAQTVDLLLQEFYFLKLEDFKVFFNRLKSGHYGQLYDVLDGSIIMTRLREYCSERIQKAEDMLIEKHEQLKAEEKEELYFVKTAPDWYLAENEKEYFETQDKARALKVDFGRAHRLKTYLIKDQKFAPNEVKVVFANKADVSLLDWVKKNKPDLITFKDRYAEKAEEYSRKKAAIMADTTIDEFERINQLREAAGLNRLTENEIMQQELEKMKQQEQLNNQNQ